MPPRLLFLVAAVLLAAIAVPAHSERNLTRPPGTTRYEAMLERLHSLQDYDHTQGSGRMSLTSLGRSVEGRGIWMVMLRDPSVAPSSSRRLFYLCRQHGHEPASTEGALSFMDKLVHADAASPLAQCLRQVTVYIVPMANPDGAEHFLRHNAHDVDLNRDWLKQSQPETRALAKAIHEIRPDFMTDQHELYPNDHRGDFTETAGPEAGCAPSVAEACEDLGTVVRLSMWTGGFPIRSVWINDRHPARLAHRYGCLVAGIPTILFETNRLEGSGRTVATRAAAQERFMTSVLRDLGGERGDLLAEAQAAGVGVTNSMGPDRPANAPGSDSEMEGQ